MNRASMLVTGQFQLFKIKISVNIGAKYFCTIITPKNHMAMIDRGITNLGKRAIAYSLVRKIGVKQL